MYLILIIVVLLSFNTTFTADQQPQDILNELVNYGDVYFERILPKELQSSNFGSKRMQSITPSCIKVLGIIDEILFDSLVQQSCDGSWKECLFKNGYYFNELNAGLCDLQYQRMVKAKRFVPKTQCNHPLEILKIYGAYIDEYQDDQYTQQKLFLDSYGNRSNELLLKIVPLEHSWFFTQLYYVGFIRCWDLTKLEDDVKPMINQNPLLQTAMIIALVELYVSTVFEDKTKISEKIRTERLKEIQTILPTYSSPNGGKFSYHNLIKFYVTQFVRSTSIQKALKTRPVGNHMIKLLNIFKCSNIGTFPDNWEDLFLSEQGVLEENDNPQPNPLNNNGIQGHNILNPPRNTWGKKELLLSTVPGIALLFLSQFLKTAPIEMKQKLHWGGFVLLISFPAITHWISNRR